MIKIEESTGNVYADPGMTQPKLSKMLRGRFRGISEAKMPGCLTRLGRGLKFSNRYPENEFR